MVCDVYLLVVLLLTTPFTFAAVSEDTCSPYDIHAELGSSLVLPLEHKTLSDKDTLRWAHNGTRIFYRQANRIRVGKPTDIHADGSLLLHKLDFSDAGDYKADVLNASNTRINGRVASLCVTTPKVPKPMVPKPVVTFVCGSDGAVATLNCNCNVLNVVFAWTQAGRIIKGETKATLSVTLAKLNGYKDFRCSVEHGGTSQVQSNPVWLKCPVIYCFNAITVMATVTGGVVLILLLLTVTSVLCHRRRKPRSQEAPPMVTSALPMVTTTELHNTDDNTNYEIMRPSGFTPRPSPTLYGRDDLLSVSKGQEGPQTTASEEKREPSPIPKPRTKAAQAAKK